MNEIKPVESLQPGDVVSFRGSGSARYHVRSVTLSGDVVSLDLRLKDLDLATAYQAGERVVVHGAVR